MRYLPIFAFFGFSALSIAGSKCHDECVHHDDHGASSHEAHTHGVAELTLVIEGDALEIELESPAANIVGFEHRAKSKQQIAAVERVRTALKSPEQVFTLQGGNCSVQQVSVDLAALTYQDKHLGHDAHHDEQIGHSEVRASYHYRCQQPETLKAIVVDLSKRFPAIETLSTRWISATGQGAIDLTAQFNRIVIE